MNQLTIEFNRRAQIERYSQGQHAPKGGASLGGKFYPGGQFIPGSAIDAATPEERSALEGKTKPTRPGFEAVRNVTGEVADKKGNIATKVIGAAHADPSQGELPEELAARIKAMKLPPAWTGVQISSDPSSPLQAIGYDAKGREQRRYSAANSAANSVAKFARVKNFIRLLPSVRERIATDMLSSDPNVREPAAVLSLIDKTGFRVGSEKDTGAEKKAHGATTLDASHVVVSGDSVTFAFVGKKGVDIHQTVSDSALAKMIGDRKLRGGKLFDTNDSKVRKYLHSVAGKFKVKDFRTAVAAESALAAMRDIEAPKTEKEYAQKRLEVGRMVSSKLGNTPKIALDSYIPPETFGSWQSNLIAQNPAPKPASPSASNPPATTAPRPPKKSPPSTESSTTKAKTATNDDVARLSLTHAFDREFYARGLVVSASRGSQLADVFQREFSRHGASRVSV